MFYKKILLALLLMLSGCARNSAETEKSGPLTLSFWTLFGGGDGKNMDSIIAAWNESQQESRVEGLLLEWGEYYTKLETAISASKAPDIGISHLSRLPEMIQQALIEEIPAKLSDAAGIDWSRYNPNILESTIYQGKHYSVPIDNHPFVLYYNKDLLAQAGLLNAQGEPDLGSGKAGFLAALEKLKQVMPSGTFPLTVPGNVDASRWFWGLYKQAGGRNFVDDNGQYQFDENIAREVLTFYKEVFERGYAPGNLDWEGYTRIFQRGEAALMYNGVWTTASLSETEGLDFSAVPVPTIYKNPGGWGDSHSLILPVSGNPVEKRQVESLKFMQYVAASGDIWAKAGHIPAYTPATQSELFQSLPHVKKYMAAASNVFFEPYHPKNWSIRNIIGQEVSALFAGQTASADQAIENIDAELGKLIQ